MPLVKLSPILLFAATLLLAGCDVSINDEPDRELIRHNAAQMLMVGFRGKTVEEAETIVADIRELGIGGVILFDRDVSLGSDRNIANPVQLQTLVADLQEIAGDSLLVGIDQEGGYVNRLKPDYGFPPTHSAQYFGTLNQRLVTRAEADQTASLLKELGINLNFAPVVDLNINPDSPAIGRWERSYSANPGVVVTQAGEVIRAHHRQGVATAIKHFPGHGSATGDSHDGFTDVTDTWQPVELEPYERLINLQLPQVVMTAHVYNAQLDPDYPATLSSLVMTDLLRGQLGFEGMIISDDMQMRAIRDEYGLKTALEKSINAGVDMLIFGNNLQYEANIAHHAVDLIETLVLDGRISQQRLQDAADRVCQLKQSMDLACQVPAPNDEQPSEE